MKKLVMSLLLCAFLAPASVVWAQDQQMAKRTPEERADRQTRMMEKRLNISKEQSDKIYNIILDHARAADNAASMPRGREKKITRRGIGKDKDDAIRRVLTGAQYQQYVALKQKQKERAMERRATMQ